MGPAWCWCFPEVMALSIFLPPDELFERLEGVPMTKEEVRAIALAKLELRPGLRMLDVGCGTGSVAISAALSVPGLEVVALDRDERALDLARENAARLRASGVSFVLGEAPVEPFDLGPFDRVFLGGAGGKVPEVLGWCAGLCVEGALLVADFVALESLSSALDSLSGPCPWEVEEVLQVSVLRGRSLGRYTVLGPGGAVFVVKARRR